jgi:hypothetical protein
MSEIEPPLPDESVVWDAPNQQVVRPDESAPWEEGQGGTTHEPLGEEVIPLDEMTKAQLLVYAGEHDVEVDQSWSNADIRAAIDEAG